MTNQPKFAVTYRHMLILAVVAGLMGLALLAMADGEMLAVVLAVGAIGSLIGGTAGYAPGERQLLARTYQTAFEWLLLELMVAYAFIVLTNWLGVLGGAVAFINLHWPPVMLTVMSLGLGAAGLWHLRDPGRI